MSDTIFVAPADIASVPNGPGVYLFYGTQGDLLYVGKSVTLRARVRSHFAERSERKMMRRVQRIEIRCTAGELGALLLESQLIKELKPLFNIAQRRRRRIVVARRVDNRDGYAAVKLHAVDHVAFNPDEPILGLFKHFTQAKEFLDRIAHEHRLCPKLLGLEQARRYCFAYHLHRCDGACMGEENSVAYNKRLEHAFNDRRVQAWPYDGPIVVEERSDDGSLREVFTVDNWCLLASTVMAGGAALEHPSGSHRFDYDAYKILYTCISDPPATVLVREISRFKQ
ncbi:MAG: GIY-YIG nuclease family protein, partial [Ignavibacteriales bacterium]|nr:GIY-YIG nuclease family protein [Ignavibacteriales bacterium]